MPTKAKVLLAEDDAALGFIIKDALEEDGEVSRKPDHDVVGVVLALTDVRGLGKLDIDALGDQCRFECLDDHFRTARFRILLAVGQHHFDQSQ